MARYSTPVAQAAGNSFRQEILPARPAGADVPQLYLTAAAGEERLRLLGFQRVELQPGESRQLMITADRRLLARFDGSDGITGNWRIAEGTYQVAAGKSAHDLVLTAGTPMRGN